MGDDPFGVVCEYRRVCIDARELWRRPTEVEQKSAELLKKENPKAEKPATLEFAADIKRLDSLPKIDFFDRDSSLTKELLTSTESQPADSEKQSELVSTFSSHSSQQENSGNTSIDLTLEDSSIDLSKSRPSEQRKNRNTITPDNSTSSQGAVRKENRAEEVDWKPQVILSKGVVQAYLQKVQYSESLARRGAVTTAKEDLHLALQMISESLDQATASNRFTKSLRRAFVALKEADEFSHEVSDISIFVAGHETPVLKATDISKISRNQARLAYYDYAEASIWKACGGQPIASEALRTLGKVLLSLPKLTEMDSQSTQAKSMLMFRLATAINPQDSHSAKELALIYARHSYLDEAQALLLRSLRIQTNPQSWEALGTGFIARKGNLGLHFKPAQKLNDCVATECNNDWCNGLIRELLIRFRRWSIHPPLPISKLPVNRSKNQMVVSTF